MYKCKDCKYFIGEQRSIGRECRNEAKTWRTEYAMFKDPSTKACKMFEPAEDLSVSGDVIGTVSLENVTEEQKRALLEEDTEKEDVMPYAISAVNKKTGKRTIFISEKVISEILKDIRDEKEDAYADFTQYADDHGFDDECDDFFHIGMKRASEIIASTIKEVRIRIEESHDITGR